MFKSLIPGAIGVTAETLDELLNAAQIGGFEGVQVPAYPAAAWVDELGVEGVKARFAQAGIRPGDWGVPVDWGRTEQAWQDGLDGLPRVAQALAQIGATRCVTFIPSGSDARPFEENLKFHIERFQPIAQILGEHGCRLGLEFLGPKTLRDAVKYPFIHTMPGMLEMASEIGPNVGLLLDCWHWHTSHATVPDLLKLRAEQVISVHVNDAPTGIATDAQIDNVRRLPGATGVIDIAGFLGALQSIGYDGPVAPEPFVKEELAALPDDAARLKVVGAAMDKVFGTPR